MLRSNSPATTRAASSKRTSTKSTKTPATSASTETSTAPGSAAITTATHPRSAAAARSDPPTKEKSKDEAQHRRKEEDNKNEKPHDARHGKKRMIGCGRCRWRYGSGFQRDASVCCNNRGDSFGEPSHCAVVIVSLQQGNHFPAKATDLAVRKDGLQPIADFHSIFAVSRRKQDQHAASLLLRSNAPLRRQPNRELLDGLASQRRNHHDRNLRSRFAIDFGAQSCQFLFRGRAEYAREIIYIALRFEILDLLRKHTNSAENKKEEEE